MADETVASLGFEVNSKPLDDAKQKLSEVSTEANKTGKAVDDFNQKVGKTGAAATNAADGVGKVDPALRALEATARRSNIPVEQLTANLAKFKAETAALAGSTGTAGTAIGSIAQSVQSAIASFFGLGSATRAVTKEHEAHNNALSGLRGNLRGLSPLLNQFGGGLGGLLQYTKAARLGLEGFAFVAAGAAIVGLEKLGDEIERTKNRFAGLTGSVEGGAKAYEAIKTAAKSSGVESAALAGAVESAIIGMEKFADKNVIYANTAEMAAKKTADVSAAFGTFGAIMQGNLANAEEENRALKALGDSFEKTGTLGVDAFNKIRTESPATAQAIANAFGYTKVSEFIRELDKAPISLDEFVKRMALVKPQIDATFDPEKPKTFEQAVRAIKDEWKLYLEELAKGGAFTTAIDLLKSLSSTIKQDIADVQALTAALKGVAGAAAGVAGNVGQVLKGNGQGGSDGIQLDPMGESTGGGQQSFSGGNTSGSSYGGTEFQSMGAYSQGSDAGAPGFDLGMADLPAFAGGGQFTVAGSGGTDSQVVSFKSTPGEVVTVSTPEQMAQSGAIQGVTTAQGSQSTTPVGVVSATPQPAALATVKEITDAIDASTIDISKKVSEGSDNIVTALNKLTGAAGAPVLDSATGLPVSTLNSRGSLLGPGAIPGSRAAAGAGGGGFSTRKSEGAEGSLNTSRPNTEGAIDAKGYFGNPSYGGGMFGGRARPVGGSTMGSRSFASRMPAGQFAQRYSGVGAAGGYYGYSPLDPNQFDYLNYDTGYGTIGDQQYGSVDYVGSNPFSDSGFGQTYDYGGADQSFNGIGTSYNDAGLGNLSYDPSANASGGFDAGYFATGGSFPVPGSPGAGVDKTLVTLHATPGETVTVTPNGVNVPALGSQSAQNADPSSQANITNKTVNIHVQAGIQAQDFIKSRAQIARGF